MNEKAWEGKGKEERKMRGSDDTKIGINGSSFIVASYGGGKWLVTGFGWM